MKKLNNKGMSIVEVVLTFALIMMITTGLLMIVVNYRNKVSISSQRLIMDTFKDNITQDLYNDMLKYGLREINEYSNVEDVNNVAEELKREINATDTNSWNDALAMVKEDLGNLEIKNYPGGSTKNVYAQALINRFKQKFGECLGLKNELNRCVNISFQATGIGDRAFGTSKVDVNSKDSIENKFLYYDGIKYAINDKMPNKLPKDSNGNDRAYKDLQRVEINDDGILTREDSVLEDGTKLSIYKIDVKVWHIDFKEDFGVHLVMSTDNLDIKLLSEAVSVKEHYDPGEAIYYNVDTGKQCTEEAWNANVSEWGSHANFMYKGGKIISRALEAMPTGLHTGCLKFYVMDDTNGKLTLLTAFNIDEIGPDKYETDSNKYADRLTYWADIKSGSDNQNVKDFNNITNPNGMDHYVIPTLKEYTKDWKTEFVSSDYTYTYTDENGASQAYTIPYRTEAFKARLITKAEYDALDSNRDNMFWLHDYTVFKKHPYNYNTEIIGYYTSDAKDNSNMYITSYASGTTTRDGKYNPYYAGIRPVITLDKRALVSVEKYYAIGDINVPILNYKVYDSGTILYFNVTTGLACTKEEADKNLSDRHTPVGVKSGCMKFYTLADSKNSSTVSLLLDHPIDYSSVAWNSDTFDGIESNSYSTMNEPVTLLNKIKEDTKDWQGVEPIENYVTEAVQSSGDSSLHFKLTIPYKEYGLKARIIKSSEIDEVFHKYTTYLDDYKDKTIDGSWYPSNPDKKISVANGMNSVIGSYVYCDGGSNYSDKCNPYGLLGYNVSEVSWVYADYQKNYSAGLNEPSALATDIFDGYDITYDKDGYAGGYWTSDIASSDSGYGYGVTFMVDGPRWTGTDVRGHMYRPVIEVKKSKFSNMKQDDSIEIVVDGTKNYRKSLENATYTISDTDIAEVDNKGKITGKKQGITYVTAVSGDKTYYAKVVVNHKPITYYDHYQSVLYNPITGKACNSSEAKCSNATCKNFLVLGENDKGNYLLATYANTPYGVPTFNRSWSPTYAIDEDPTGAEAKYGDMAHDHWYKVLEYVANDTKNWHAEVPSYDYIDFTTKDYMINWTKPAYYENGNPVYSHARILNLEDVDGMYRNWSTTENGYPYTNVYELINNNGNTTVIMRGLPVQGDYVFGKGIVGYLTNYWSSTYDSSTGKYIRNPNNTISVYVIEVKKDKITGIYDGSEPPLVFRSTSEAITVSKSYTFEQSSTDGGEVTISSFNNWMYRVTPKKNGHVKLVGTPTNGVGDPAIYDITIDLQYSCGQIDVCGNPTPACN